MRVADHARALAMAAALATAAVALAEVPAQGMPPRAEQWWWLLASLVLAGAAQFRHLRPPPAAAAAATTPVSRARLAVGCALSGVGGGLWLWATMDFHRNWYTAFDRAWLAWLAGTALLGGGLDLLHRRGATPAVRSRGRAAWLVTAFAIGGVAAWLRLAAIGEFPGPAGITQIEDLQFGHWGAQFLAGERRRWEFIGHAWISAAAIAAGGASLESMRTGYAIVGSLTVVAVCAWLRGAVGAAAALTGAAYMAVSSWDIVISRIGFNPDVLTVAVLYALLLGPTRRGRPSAYAAIGLLGGYLLWEYIAYRPATLFAAAGASWISVRDRGAGWWMRAGRPLLMLALIAMMSLPLFGARLQGRVWAEYFNGLDRARAQRHYYNESHDWRQAVELRVGRALDTAGLLFFLGDASPTRNLGRRPLVDPVSATLMLVGFAGCAVNPAMAMMGMFAAAFLFTAAGAMVVTSDFNALRMSVTIPYLYFFVGVAAAGLWTVWQRAWGRAGQGLAVIVLAAGLAWAARANIEFLAEYRAAPAVRKALRNNLAYLSNWLRDNVDADEQVVGVAGRSSNALIGNDAAWLRAHDIPGALEWDVVAALHAWRQDWPTMFLIFAGRDTQDTARFVQSLVPQAQFRFVADAELLGADLAWARVPGRPAGLDEGLRRIACRGAAVEYQFRGDRPGEVRKVIRRVEPLVGLSTWPSEVVAAFYAGYWPTRLAVTHSAEIEIRRGGEYLIEADFYGAEARIEMDDMQFVRSRRIHLDAGWHRLRVTGDFAPLPEGLVARLMWSGPDSGGIKELIPFYSVAAAVADCAE